MGQALKILDKILNLGEPEAMRLLHLRTALTVVRANQAPLSEAGDALSCIVLPVKCRIKARSLLITAIVSMSMRLMSAAMMPAKA